MKILFTNPAPIIKYGIEIGFQKNGWETRNMLLNEQNIEDFTKIVDEFKPDYVLTEGGINKSDWVFPVIKSKGLSHIYWAIEDPVWLDSLSLEWAQQSVLVLTPCIEALEFYEKKGHKAICIPFAIDEDYYNTKKIKKKYSKLDAIFIGNNYNYYDTRHKAYLDVIQPFIDEKKKIEIYGNDEWINKDFNFNVKPQYYKGYMSHEETPIAFSSTKIVLGVHSVVDSLTMQSMRTFEVLGCQGFFLSSYTKSLEHMFENHVHLTYSKNPEETKEIMDFYLNNEDARRRISINGQKEVYEKHTYKQRVIEIIKTLEGER